MTEVALTCGKVALVDDADADLVNRYRWQYAPSGYTGYARTTLPLGRRGAKHGVRRKRTSMVMHRLILNAPTGLEVDHINGDGLDNRRQNLRLVTRSQQCMNRRAWGKKTTPKGITWNKRLGKWAARIRVGGKFIHLGFFAEAEVAVAAYQTASDRYFEEYALHNSRKTASMEAVR